MSNQCTGRVTQINVHPQGGVPKQRVAEAEVTTEGVKGDKQRDRRFHGGPERAVCLFSAEQIAALRDEGHTIAPGTTGENLTVSGIDWATLDIGDCFQIGERVVLQITAYASPCANIAGSFAGGEFKRMSQKLHPGWSRVYARVLTEGTVREGDEVAFVVGGG